VTAFLIGGRIIVLPPGEITHADVFRIERLRVIDASLRSSASIRGRSPATISTIAQSNSSRWLTRISAST
jgi:hypothetical protein